MESLLREAKTEGDHAVLAHALLAFVSLESVHHLRDERRISGARLRATWVDLVGRLT